MTARTAIVLCIILSFLAGCRNKAEAPPPKAPPPQEVVIGLLPEQNIFRQLERYEPLAAYLSARCKVKIRLKVLPRYGNIIDNFVSAGFDGAFFGSFTYALAHTKLGVEVFARPEGLDGTSTYYGLMFVRRDSGIRGLKDMRGKRFAFVDKSTTAGYLLPLEYFTKHGVKDYRAYLKEFYFTGTHEDAIYDVLNKRADIGAAKNTVFERLAAEDGRISRDLLILERSPEVPENGLAVRKDLDAPLKERLKGALLSMHEDPQGQKVLVHFGARRFIETRDEDYEPVYRYAREINLDLNTFDYRNE